MPTRDLGRLLQPRSIAVIGGRHAEAVIRQCRRMGFEGPIWPVHPHRDAMLGLPVSRTVAQLPAAPDAAFVGVNREAAIDVIAALARIGAGGAVCYAAGFREEGDYGRALEQALVSAAGAMPVLGPNCYGLIGAACGAALWPDQHGVARLATGQRGVAVLCQSSNIAINVSMQRRGLPLAYLVTVGNQAQTGLSQLAQAMLADARVTALGLYVEGIDSVPGFEALARQSRRRGKPVVVLKIGRSELSRRAALTHTASMAGSRRADQAFFQRLGFAEVADLADWLEVLKFLHVHPRLPGNAVASLSCSGGEAALLADAVQPLVESGALRLPAPSDAQRTALSAVLGDRVAVANPMDYHTYIWGDGERMARVYAAMMQAPMDHVALILDFPIAPGCDDADWRIALDALRAAVDRRGGFPTALVSTLPENLPQPVAETLIQAGIAPIAGLAAWSQAAAAAARFAVTCAAADAQPLLALPVRPDPQTPTVIAEDRAKALLAAAGLAVPAGACVDTLPAALAFAEAAGYPVVLKCQGLAHKTEQGGVRLNLQNADQLRAAWRAMAAAGAALYIETMVTDAIAELLIGVRLDPPYGWLLTLGSGGVLVELQRDAAHVLMPAAAQDIHAALRSLRLYPLLTGYRGRPAADLDAVLQAVLAVQTWAAAHADQLLELDINPLLVRPAPQPPVAVDALLVTRTGKLT